MDKCVADKYYDMALLSACRLIGINLDQFDEFDSLHQYYLIFSTVQLYNRYKGEDPAMPLPSNQYGNKEALDQIYEDTKKLACRIGGVSYEEFDDYDSRHLIYHCLATLRLFSSSNIEKMVMKAPKKQDKKTLSDDEELDYLGSIIYENLLKWRNREADFHNQPRYAILPNMTLKNIAQYKPISHDDLLCIRGIGIITQDKYGDQILDIVREIQKNESNDSMEKQRILKKEEDAFADFPLEISDCEDESEEADIPF
jgi:hypothetical protein